MKFSNEAAALTALLVSQSALANIDFATYCNQGDECSTALITAVSDANGTQINIPAGTYTITDFYPESSGASFSQVKIQGAGKNNTTIRTNRFWPGPVSDISIKGIRFVAINPTTTGGLYYDGALVALKKASRLTFSDNSIIGAPEALLSIRDSNELTITNNTLRDSGLARKCRGDGVPIDCERNTVPIGGAISMSNINYGTITNNDIRNIWQIGIFGFSTGDGKVSKLIVSDNTIDTVFDNGIRFNGSRVSDVVVEKNSITQTEVDGIRINGNNMTVQNNNIESTTGTTGIKAHYLTNSRIRNNTIRKTYNGITMHPFGQQSISNVEIHDNFISGMRSNGIAATGNSNASYRNLDIVGNEIYNFENHAIVLYGHSSNLSTSNIHTNTISNTGLNNQFNHWAVRIDHHSNLYFGNNYIHGQSYGSLPHVQLNNVKNGVIETNSVISPNTSKAGTGGFVLDTGTTSIDFQNNRFTNISPGYCDFGSNNNSDTADRC